MTSGSLLRGRTIVLLERPYPSTDTLKSIRTLCSNERLADHMDPYDSGVAAITMAHILCWLDWLYWLSPKMQEHLAFGTRPTTAGRMNCI